MSSSVPPRRPVGASTTGPDKKRRPWWLLALLALAALIALALLLSRCGKDDKDDAHTAPPAAAVSQTPSSAAVVPSVAAVPAVTGAAPSTGTDAAPSTGTGDGAGELIAGTTDLLAGPATASGAMSSYTGKTVTGTDVLVQSVPADEGFWVGPDTSNRVWVQLKGTGESGYQVQRGDRIDLHGSLTANPAGFPRTVGVDAREGAEQLTTQAQHITVAKNAVTLHR